LQRQGDFAKALEELRRGHAIGSKNPSWRYPSTQWLRQCQRLLELDGGLPDFLTGKATPANAGERIELAELCAFKRLNRGALRFYEDAFAAQPTLLAGHRYNAACAAALAGCGRGKDTVKLDDKERARLRRRALDWLCADLEAQGRLLDKEPAPAATNVAGQLQHWLADPDLVGVRETKELANLPPDEQDEWGCLWEDIAEQTARARKAAQRKPPAAPAKGLAQPGQEAAPLPDATLLAQARYYIRRSQWVKAAAEYAKVDFAARPLGDDALAYACLLLIRNDSEGYHRFCQGIIQRAVETETHFDFYLLARICAMARKGPVAPPQAVSWANQAVAAAPSPWYIHALGLAQYRAGQLDQALHSLTKANVKAWNFADLNWFGLALVNHHLGHSDEAQRCFDKGIQWLERVGPSGPERTAMLQPQDWLEAQLLRREAEEILKRKQSP
jgi:tetratricopeptide (TPR) repeat protein